MLTHQQCPFNVLRNEVIAIFGRVVRLLNDNEEPVHIILEKVTAKTQDAYAEFESPEDAVKALRRIQENVANGRPPRIGNRQVTVEFSSQAALMKDLFPVAHGVTWQESHPVIVTDSPFPINNFKCFTSEEENNQLSRHFECFGRVSSLHMFTYSSLVQLFPCAFVFAWCTGGMFYSEPWQAGCFILSMQHCSYIY
jgi:hypothetical protein